MTEKGNFHFRNKVPNPVSRDSFVWQDMTDENQIIQNFPSESLPHVRALPVVVIRDHAIPNSSMSSETKERPIASQELPPPAAEKLAEKKQAPIELSGSNSSDSDHSSSEEESPKKVPSQKTSPPQRQVSAEQPNFETIAASASSYMKSFGGFLKKSAQKATAMSSVALPNTQQRAVMEMLACLLTKQFDKSSPADVDAVKRAWTGGFPHDKFAAKHEAWLQLGFTQENAISDKVVRKAGMMGWNCLAYYLEHNYGRMRNIQDCKLAILPCVVRCILKLVDCFGLENRQYENDARSYWALLEGGSGSFFELISFMMTLGERSVSQGTSQKEAIGFAFKQVSRILEESPQNINSFYQTASKLKLL